jgi:hypothetical protein
LLCQLIYARITVKRIFLAGAPGSKWSSVAKNIYYSPSIDRSDYRNEWTYYHDASGTMQLMHLGAYWDPGMACPLPEDLTVLSKSQAEQSFDYPFDPASQGVRIIKSHIFSCQKNMEYLRDQWATCPIVLVHRSNDSCLGWWVKCGHFDITYPNYQYYHNLRDMAQHIAQQNTGIRQAWTLPGTDVADNLELCAVLGLEPPPEPYRQCYQDHDIEVRVLS